MLSNVLARRSFGSTIRRTPKLSYLKTATNVATLVEGKLHRTVEKCEQMLGRRFPEAVQVIKSFSRGTKSLSSDYVQYAKISGQLMGGASLRDLTYQELMLYFQAPKDMTKVGPFVLLAMLPFVGYIILPLMYFYPKLLTSQFWTVEQKVHFQAENLIRRLQYCHPILNVLAADVFDHRLQLESPELANGLLSVVHKLENGSTPSGEELLAVKDLFSKGPYALKNLKLQHLYHLCQLNNVRCLPPLERRLHIRTSLVRELDLSILRQGGAKTLSREELLKACLIRGINPFGCRAHDLTQFLSEWTWISNGLDDDSLSLLAHCPLFLGFNFPSNAQLTH